MTNLEYIKSCSTRKLASFIYDLMYEKDFKEEVDVDYENQDNLWGRKSKEDLIEVWLGREKRETEREKTARQEIINVLNQTLPKAMGQDPSDIKEFFKEYVNGKNLMEAVEGNPTYDEVY